jgi:hypothetical protein
MHSLGKAERYTVHKAWDLNLADKWVQLVFLKWDQDVVNCFLTHILGPRVIISQVSMRRQDFIPHLCSPSNQKRDFLKDIQKRVKNKLF